jgi:enoyl-[acyl-carrier protein] reductase II
MSYVLAPLPSLAALFGVRYPIVQAGMVWVSGGRLAAAAAEAGCLGLIGSASMTPDLLRRHIVRARELTSKPFGVNVPLLYPKAQERIDAAIDEGIRVFFTSAGSPRAFTGHLKDKGATVVHVASSPTLARKCQDAGVDAVVVEGFEAGGHNGRDEITTMVLVREAVDAVSIPVIAAGGIGDGRAIAAAMALGAAGVQIGSRFAATVESSAHDAFKQAVVRAGADATMLTLKKLTPVRLLKNAFAERVSALEASGASAEDLREALGKGRARRGMFEGDLDEGELEIGQVSGVIGDLPTCAELVARLVREYENAVADLPRTLAPPGCS